MQGISGDFLEYIRVPLQEGFDQSEVDVEMEVLCELADHFARVQQVQVPTLVVM